MIGAVEDEIVDRLRQAFGARVREVDHKPAKLDADELSRILTMAPAAYVSFLGFQPAEGRMPGGTFMAAFGVYLLAANASGDVARRRGHPTAIGAYDMVARATRQLGGWRPPSAAQDIAITSCENLFSAAFEKAGRTCYGLALTVPLRFGAAEEEDLGDLRTLDVIWDVPPLGNVPPPPNPEAIAAVPAPTRDAADRVTVDPTPLPVPLP